MSKQQPPAASTSPRSGSTTLIVVAMALGLFTVILTNVYIAVVKEEASSRAITVYKLTRDVEPGHRLDSSRDLREVQIAEEFEESMSDAVTPEALPNQNGEEITRFASEGDLLTFQLFHTGGDMLDQKIAVGKRGTPLPLNSRSAPGLLRPGMFIDIMATLQPREDQRPRTLVVMERVRVVAVGSDTDPGGGGRRSNYGTITVEVEPEASRNLLAISQFIGRDGFDVDVRNPSDDQTEFIGINPEVLRVVGLE